MNDEAVAKSGNVNFKKILLLGNVAFLLFLLSLVVFYFVLVPRTDIDRLQKEYVALKIENKKASYKIVKKKPKSWVTLKQMNYTAAHAIVTSEDWYFYHHNGYDLGQIKEAVVDTFSSGKKLRGASTISQQVIKNLFFSNDRSFLRKISELMYTIYLERTVTKEKILEVYLNIIEFGEGLYGVKDASWFYFKKSPKTLTAREGAFLAMLLPNPKTYSQSFRDKKLTEYATETVGNILKKMVKAKYLTEAQYESMRQQKFGWEDGKRRVNKQKRKRRSGNGAGYEARYREDADLKLDDNPTFDEDALIEDTSGLQEEFNQE